METATSAGRPELLEAGNVVKSNLTFHHLLEEELERGEVSYERVFSRWRDWLEGAGA